MERGEERRCRGTHHSSLGLGVVHVGVEQHSCVIVRGLQGDGQSVAAILQMEGERKKQDDLQTH